MPSCKQTFMHRARTSTGEADFLKEANKSRVIQQPLRAARSSMHVRSRSRR